MKSFEENNFKEAADAIIELANSANLYLNNRAPWKLIKDTANKAIVANDIYTVLETCRIIAVLLFPLVPDLSNRIFSQLKVDENTINFNESLEWGRLNPSNGLEIAKPVMEKIEYDDSFIS